MKGPSRIPFGVLCLFIALSAAAAYNPPAGGESAPALLSPDLLAGTPSAAGGAFGGTLPGELAVNPALAAAEQRITLDASYAALVGLGDESGLGHSLTLGGIYPTRWSVLGGSLAFLTSPFDGLPLGTSGSLRFSASKDLTDRLYAGAGLSAAAGTGWGIAGDLGVLFLTGDLGFLKDTRIGASLTGLGLPFSPGTEGIHGGSATGYPSMITPRFGIAGTLLANDSVKLGMTADLSVPAFQNLVFDAGLEAVVKDALSLRAGWNLNVVESLESAQSYLPSFGLGMKLKLNSPKEDSFLARNGWSQSDLTPSIGAKPLPNGVWAMGAGVNVKLGVVDQTPPSIEVTYPEPVYISPNNDGVKDVLEFPVKITDSRYVLAWSFLIEDASGNVVRTIANKEIRPEMQDLKSFWSLLTKRKEGIALPESLRWDGTMDSGETAPDGTYFFSVNATDDNDNRGTTEKYTVYVDNTAPTVTAVPPSGANAMIFSPDGDGNKDTFRIAQTSSPEDLWTAQVTTAAGTAARTVETREGALADFVWDGKGDTGALVADGVYAYRVSAMDRAGNTAEARVDNIILDTEKPSINVSIDINAFSPNGDKAKDTLVLAPSVPVVTGLIGWKVTVVGRNDTPVRTWTGTGSPKAIPFDGRDDSGNPVAEGDYQGVISATYINGFAPVARSPFFTLDVTPPEASAIASGPIFSPVGDGKLDTVSFTQSGSRETSWTGQVFALGPDGNAAGKAVRTWQFGQTPDVSVLWDGRDDAGKLAPDGKYGYRLSAVDKAGNPGQSNLAVVELNTEKADLILQANLPAFSPNGDSVKDSIVFTPVIKAATAVASWKLTVRNASDSIVKTWTGNGKVPAAFTWNGIADPAEGASVGERSPDGTYGASLEVTLVNQQVSSSRAPDFEIDTVYPSVEISAPYLAFSPNGDGRRDTLPLSIRTSEESLWTGTLSAPAKAPAKNLRWNGKAEGFSWDATDDSGNPVADGTYVLTLASEDKAGNRTEQKLSGIQVDARVPKVYLTASLAAFSPNGDGVKDSQEFGIVTSLGEGLESWSLAIKPEGTKTEGTAGAVKSWSSAESAALPQRVNWDGKTASGALAQGRFFAELTLAYAKGDRVTAATPAFLSNAVAPQLAVRLSPKYFSPDNDGIDDELTIALQAVSASPFTDWSFEIREPAGTAGNLFWKAGGAGTITDQIIWDGRSLKGELVQAATDYPFTFTVKDDVGQTSVVKGYIPVDVLVIRDGDRLKIAVPSIIFRENGADFNGLEQGVVDKNVQVLKRIAEILNKFRDYKIQIEGHANNVTGTQKEEDTELIPLSQKRAEAVRDFLVRNGVDAQRLSTVGMGGTRPVAGRADRENWWKNRRVEFILIK